MHHVQSVVQSASLGENRSESVLLRLLKNLFFGVNEIFELEIKFILLIVIINLSHLVPIIQYSLIHLLRRVNDVIWLQKKVDLIIFECLSHRPFHI